MRLELIVLLGNLRGWVRGGLVPDGVSLFCCVYMLEKSFQAGRNGNFDEVFLVSLIWKD